MTVVLKKSKLKYHLKVKNGREVTNEVNYGKNVIDVYGSGGVFKYTDKKLFTGPSVLFGRKGTIGKPLYVEGDFWAVDTMYYTEVYSGNSPRYFYYLLEVFPWGKIVTQTALPSIVGSELESYEVNIPSEEVQKIIAKFLDRKCVEIETLLKHKERLLILLEQQRQSIITESVTKGLNANVKMKDSGVEWIGEVPEHWEIKKIKHITQVKRGASPRPIDDPKYFDDDGEYAWVRIADVSRAGMYLNETSQIMSELGASLSIKQYPGDLFVSIAGTVGKPCISNIKCCIHDGFVYFPNYKYNEKFLYYIFACGQSYKGLGKMGTQLNLNTDTIGEIKIPWPSVKEQEDILNRLEEYVNKLDKLIGLVNFQIKKLTEYRQSLIYEAVTGKIDVRDMELDEVR
ncbi:restriction endonuclease subunit S [Bacillus pumilus]|uniref:restriction endonuclease subunit S n=1 Tax=Bacillus pumilus TaxID=1408 RepID=UPI0011A6DBE0|nr:restriction endonuclease subunit S [Bacillus pumilus]MBU8727480.1 restriction endonuclease subunit S [Bacillus pumilus]